MKSFKEYLTESKKTYNFKIKIAHECPEDCAEKIKEALSVYGCESCSSGASMPIQESHFDFPTEKNVKVTAFEVCLNYPTNSREVRAAVSNRLKKAESCVIVRNPAEEAEVLLNHANDEKPSGAVLDKAYDKENNQGLVGDKQVSNFLKELSKEKKSLTQVKGVNEKILAKKAPKHVKETPGQQVEVKNNATNIFTKQVKIADPYKGAK
jgi:hypothetical protein